MCVVKKDAGCTRDDSMDLFFGEITTRPADVRVGLGTIFFLSAG